MNANCMLPLAALLVTLAPARNATPQDDGATKPAPSAAQTAQELERKAREVLGGVVDAKADEIARRLRGEAAGTAGAPVTGEDEDEDVDVDGDGDVLDDEDEMSGTDDPVLGRLTSIDERLCTIEALLLDMSARAAPAAGAAPATPPVALAAPAVPTAGSPVTSGFDKARVRVWHEGKEATVKLSVNGIPAGRFDSSTTFDLAPFLQPGRMNQVSWTIEPHGKADVTGMAIHVEGQMKGAHDYVAILQFSSAAERLADTFELPWAPR